MGPRNQIIAAQISEELSAEQAAVQQAAEEKLRQQARPDSDDALSSDSDLDSDDEAFEAYDDARV